MVLRFFSGEGVPVSAIASTPGETKITINPDSWSTLARDGVDDPSLFAIADCSYADVFQASATNKAAGTITFRTSNGLNSALDFSERYAGGSSQAVLYRAESFAYYVAAGAGGEPALYRLRFNPKPGLTSGQTAEELVDGIENLQFLYARDENPVDKLNGNITKQDVASSADFGAAEQNWRRVGMVQVGVLARSPTPASTPAASLPAIQLRARGVSFTPVPTDQRTRSTYEVSIAERNRLYGN